MTIKELRQLSGMTQQAFAKYFGMSKRAIESWEGGQRNCPQYLLDLMEYKLKNECLIREKEYVLKKALKGKRTPEEAKAHIKELATLQEKISRKAADAEANAMTLEIEKYLKKDK